MKVVITGGGGFLGNQLGRAVLNRGRLTGVSGGEEEVDRLVLFDVGFSEAAKSGLDERAAFVAGDIANRGEVFSLVDRDDISVFHLASMVSGECEQRFDDAMRVNLDGGRNVFEACRARASTPRVVFASSIAAFGGSAMPMVVGDETKATPQTTYGMTKVIGELMINDYTRKGFIDGRAARLPTIIIRPGKPNAAASSFASGVFREPLGGETCELPVARSQKMPVLGYRTVVDSFIGLHEADSSRLGDDRAFGLPSGVYTVQEMIATLVHVAEKRGIALGPIEDKPDPVIERIVKTWPTATDGSRALALGLPDVSTLEAMIEDYIDDFLG